MMQNRSRYIFLLIPAAIIVGFFFFPLQLRSMPMNTKTIMAGVGLFLLVFESLRSGRSFIRKDLIELTIIALAFSLICYTATIVNNTPDNTYTAYFISMWVWLSAGYTTIYFIRLMYGRVSVPLLCDLLVLISVIQCASAIMIDMSPTVHDFINRYIDHDWTESVNRLYGISAELDTAGIRFSVVLLMVTYILCNRAKYMSNVHIFLYWAAFVIITIIGNMIARTTTIGTALGLAYILWKSGIPIFKINQNQYRSLKIMVSAIIIFLPITILFYFQNDNIKELLRFGFEGFFSLFESGEWSVASNEHLQDMIVWPESMKTWIIGDGYIVNPEFDRFYIGDSFHGFYMNTDIGYIRFIFYCGLLGLITFTYFIFRASVSCANHLPKYKILIYGLLLLNFIIWLKVATDLFFIFALLYCIDAVDENEDLITY